MIVHRRAVDGQNRSRVVPAEPLCYEILRRLPHRRIAGGRIGVGQVPVPDLGALEPAAALGTPYLEKSVEGVRLLLHIRRVAGPSSGADIGAVEAAIARLREQD